MRFLLIIFLFAGCSRVPPCYQPVSHERGWKRVPLPDNAPHLYAVSDVDQFRGGEATLIWGDWRHDYDTSPSMGSMRYTFYLPPGSERMTIRFSAYLGGAAVEAEGIRDYESYSLLHRSRSNSDELELEVMPDTDRVIVTVHHHLRAAPGIYGWRVGWRARVDAEGFMAPRMLYYFDPGNEKIELCETPEKMPAVNLANLEGAPTQIAIRPTWRTRIFN
jgi:hypothetical protein